MNVETTAGQASWLAPFPRRFVDGSLAIHAWDDLEPYYARLSTAEAASEGSFRQWLSSYSELKSVADEFVTRRYIAMTCHTDDPAKKEAYLYCVRELEPKMAEWEDKLNRRYGKFADQFPLDKAECGQMDRGIRVSVELFDERNIPIQVKLSELSQSYQELIGGMTVNFDGEERTLPQMGALLREQDRGLRERAFCATAERRLAEKEKLENIFDEMLQHRAQFAANLGLPTYREYCFKAKLRDYTPHDCVTFHGAIEKTAVPLARKIMERRKKEMGLDKLCPWDTACDPLGRPPLKPFAQTEELFGGVKRVFDNMDPRLGEMFGSIGFSMDLDSRKGKAPGGYQASLEEARIPFIFTNAVGLQDDVNTLLHEGGHSFHTLMGRDQEFVWNRHAGMEFSEVASMSVELAGVDSLTPFYSSKEEMDRAKRERLEDIASLFPWVAQVDAFQQWIYTHPGHTPGERMKTWLELSERFSAGVDWSGAPKGAREYQWHRQLHIFELPFYYIEYAIAQLGALQIYKRFKEDKAAAVDGYLAALKLGGSRPPKDLFAAAGARFDFSEGLLGELMDFVRRELEL